MTLLTISFDDALLWGSDADASSVTYNSSLFDFSTVNADDNFGIALTPTNGNLGIGAGGQVASFSANASGTASFAANLPGPASWGLMIMGLGSLGLALRVRRRETAFA